MRTKRLNKWLLFFLLIVTYLLSCTTSAFGWSRPSGSGKEESYVRTMTCAEGEKGSSPSSDLPCKPGQKPRPIAWPTNCLLFYVNETGSAKFNPYLSGGPALPKEAIYAVKKAFYAWNAPVTSSLEFYYGGLTNETEVRVLKKNNVNAVLWRDSWPEDLPTALALTSVNYNPKTGVILGADIEVNTDRYEISFPPMPITTDLQNMLTHEAGHFLGLNHTRIPDSTMYGSARAGETTKRKLKKVDRDGVSAIYPQGSGQVCDFSSAPSYFDVSKNNQEEEGSEDGCSSTGSGSNGLFSLLVAGLGLCLLRRRRR